MKRFVVGEARGQSTLFPERLDDFIAEDNPVRVIDVFVEELDLRALGFAGVDPQRTGRPAYHPATLLKIYIYGYLNRLQSSRRLEREALRNVELMWLTERLAPDFKTIADFRKDNGKAIRRVCRQFVVLCRQLNVFAEAMVAIDGSNFKAVNNRDRNVTRAKLNRRLEQIRREDFRDVPEVDAYGCPAGERLIWRYRSVEDAKTLDTYRSSACPRCALKIRCTPGAQRRIRRWEHEAVLETVQARLDREPEKMRLRRQTVEHPFGTLKAWMGYTHFLTGGLRA